MIRLGDSIGIDLLLADHQTSVLITTPPRDSQPTFVVHFLTQGQGP